VTDATVLVAVHLHLSTKPEIPVLRHFVEDQNVDIKM
jgi:hypothetical protein